MLMINIMHCFISCFGRIKTIKTLNYIHLTPAYYDGDVVIAIFHGLCEHVHGSSLHQVKAFRTSYLQTLNSSHSILRDNLGEPQQLGFGLDLKGFQTTIEFVDMQAHSLTPTGGTDMQFSLVDNLIMGFGVRLSFQI